MLLVTSRYFWFLVLVTTIWMANCLVVAISCFRLQKVPYLQNFYSVKKWILLEIVDKNVLKLMTLPNNLLFVGFKTLTLCSVHSAWFVKYVFSANIWFVKTSNTISKYQSRVVKSNLVTSPFWYLHLIQFFNQETRRTNSAEKTTINNWQKLIIFLLRKNLTRKINASTPN